MRNAIIYCGRTNKIQKNLSRIIENGFTDSGKGQDWRRRLYEDGGYFFNIKTGVRIDSTIVSIQKSILVEYLGGPQYVFYQDDDVNKELENFSAEDKRIIGESLFENLYADWLEMDIIKTVLSNTKTHTANLKK